MSSLFTARCMLFTVSLMRFICSPLKQLGLDVGHLWAVHHSFLSPTKSENLAHQNKGKVTLSRLTTCIIAQDSAIKVSHQEFAAGVFATMQCNMHTQSCTSWHAEATAHGTCKTSHQFDEITHSSHLPHER